MMNAWEGKYVIGLTGNIASGKSVVRKMLEHLGAYGIDADALAHRAIARNAPGYSKVVEEFGKQVLDKGGEIDRRKLGEIVFAKAEALASLEAIVHPLVRLGVDHLVRQAKQEVVVIEAIKLLESPLREACDRIWVTIARDEVRLKRLIQKRGMDAQTARERMAAQSPQGEKVAAANCVIENNGEIENTWRQVKKAWDRLFPEIEAEEAGMPDGEAPPEVRLSVERARPQQAEEIAGFLRKHSPQKRGWGKAEVMDSFGEKAYLLLRSKDGLVGVVGWNVENLVARTDEVYLDNGVPAAEALTLLFEEVERASWDLQCEASLVFVPPALAEASVVWSGLGYQRRSIEELRINAWQTAARESRVDGAVMLFKQLRLDRILRPI